MNNSDFRKPYVYLMYAETQVHAGCGQEVGTVDLPIQRERTTRFPIIQGIKGAIRSFYRLQCTQNKECAQNSETEIFGSAPGASENETPQPGAIAFSEAKILLFPVRNPDELFVWITSPLAIKRFYKALEKESTLGDKIKNLDDNTAIVFNENFKNNVWLEEVKLEAIFSNKKEWDFINVISQTIKDKDIRDRLNKNIVIVSDKVFSNIVETMTEVIPRIVINRDTKTTDNLWYEEYLPQDTIMYFTARLTFYASNNHDLLNELNKAIDGKVIPIGGKETIGKGLVRILKIGSSKNTGDDKQ